MKGPTKKFLLPCGACGRDIELVSGQAGGRATCGSCGAANDVPKLRDLGRLRVKDDHAVNRPAAWGLPQALMLVGIVCGLGSFGLGRWIGATPKSAISPELTRDNIEAGDDLQLYESLVNLAAATVERPPIRIEEDLQRRARFAAGISRTLYVLGGLGAVVALAAAAMHVFAAKPR